ncbi:hypothetical protein HMN09_00716900 [Mycena chlorophos]|uniref:Uncharacterized protein n=1 Tax=Mycena chlorophos TaxID=658473 RepID=A0A8H6T0G5_MYCCL|nr:hypothetical protein HMN09_00716900 [Mycena chlorophos]
MSSHVDWNHPELRQYLALVRLQMTTPLSLLINIATVSICATVVNPSIQTIAKLNPTPISPRPSVILVYIAALFIAQIGYCTILLISRKEETKARGFSYSAHMKSNFLRILSLKASASRLCSPTGSWPCGQWRGCVFEWFIAATVLSGLLFLFLLYSNVNLLVYHAPTSSRPLDTALIHAPLRFFFVLQFALVFPLTLFIALGLTYTPMYDGTPIDYNAHGWPGFGVVFGTQLVSLLVIIFRRDIVWCVAATWICISLFSLRPKAQSVYITAIAFTVVHPLGLLFGFARSYMSKRDLRPTPHGPVALTGDDSDHPGLQNAPSSETQIRGPREVDVEDVWGN